MLGEKTVWDKLGKEPGKTERVSDSDISVIPSGERDRWLQWIFLDCHTILSSSKALWES